MPMVCRGNHDGEGDQHVLQVGEQGAAKPQRGGEHRVEPHQHQFLVQQQDDHRDEERHRRNADQVGGGDAEHVA